jgi:hypothetical protein
MSTENAPHTGVPTPAPAGGTVDRSKWRYLKDMELPPEVKREVEDYCRSRGLRRPRHLKEVEEDVKLQYFFGGQWVAYEVTSQGRLVICAGDPDSEEFRAALASLPREERRRVICFPVWRWNDSESWF